MDNKKFSTLIAEILNWGPSPFAPGTKQPMPFLFYNEMASLTGTAIYEGFERKAAIYLLTTSFRFILYQKQKRGNDRCRSYWRNLVFGDWHWKDPDGFIICGVQSTPIQHMEERKKNEAPTIFWDTHFVNPDGEKKLFEQVRLGLQEYHFHQKSKFVPWNKKITIPGKEKAESKLALTYYVSKLAHGNLEPGPGRIDLDALWLLHEDPFKANITEVGYIDPESPLHPDNATRGRTAVTVSSSARNTGKSSPARKIGSTAKKAVQTYAKVKGAVDTAQKVGSILTDGGKAVKNAVSSLRKVPGKAPANTLQFCGKCGTPISAGGLFCGKCGQKLIDKAIDKAKEELKGKAEDKIIEKIEEALDDKAAQADREETVSKDTSTKKQTRSRKKAAKPAKKTCPNCGQAIKSEWKFCPSCSQSLNALCPACGVTVEPEWKFCPNCTEELKPKG